MYVHLQVMYIQVNHTVKEIQSIFFKYFKNKLYGYKKEMNSK